MDLSHISKKKREFDLKILLVSDTYESAISIAARARAKLIGADVVYAANLLSPLALLDYIGVKKYGVVLFCWRGALKDGLSLTGFYNKYRTLSQKIVFLCLVPDFLGLNPRFLSEEKKLLDSVHGYWVTSNQLKDSYSEVFSHNLPKGILHDLPDCDLILENFSIAQEFKVIWVGNSSWGKRYGYKDHKGFERFVKPVFNTMKNKIPNLEFEILDSKNIRVSNQEVIEKISRSRVLLQTSDSEGTGLPILEALGLGVAPVTRDVGIAKEILLGELSKFIVNTDLDDIEKTIQIALKFKNRELLINTYDSFISRAKSENVVWQVTPILLPWERSAPIKIVKIKMVWIYRHFKSKRTI